MFMTFEQKVNDECSVAENGKLIGRGLGGSRLREPSFLCERSREVPEGNRVCDGDELY